MEVTPINSIKVINEKDHTTYTQEVFPLDSKGFPIRNKPDIVNAVKSDPYINYVDENFADVYNGLAGVPPKPKKDVTPEVVVSPVQNVIDPSWLKQLGLDFITPEVSEPKIETVFHTIAGKFKCYFHAIVREGDLLLLIRDERTKSEVFEPSPIVDSNGDTNIIQLSIDGSPQFPISVMGVKFKLGILSFQLFVVEQIDRNIL